MATVEGASQVALQDDDGWTISVSTEDADEADLMLHAPRDEVTCDDGTEPRIADIAAGQTISYQRASDDLMESHPPGIDAKDVTIDC